MAKKNIAKIEPKPQIKTRPAPPQQQQKEEEQESLLLEYNDKTEESYLSQNLTAPEYLDSQEKNFLAAVDITKAPIERTVTRIVRLKAPDYSSPKKERKEFLVWYENWRGKNWAGISIAPVADHIEGVYQEQETEPLLERNRIVGHQRTGQHSVHYVPFSKEKVDEIIESSVGSDKETITYIVKDGPLRNDKYSYEQFVNLSFNDCVRLLHKKGGPALATLEQDDSNSSAAKSLEDMAAKARTVNKETKSSFEIVVDKDKEEPDIKLEKSVGVQVENKNRQQEEQKDQNKEEERKIVKPNFKASDFKV